MDTDEIKNLITTCLEKLGVASAGVDLQIDPNTGSNRFSIQTPEWNLLIGNQGATLLALSHIIKKIADKRTEMLEKDPLSFIVDVNDYQERRIEEIKGRAQILAERARSFQRNIEMDPMSSYERMIVHSILSESSDIKTESVGTGKDRRVVIKFSA
ncbi:hypothetical protein L0Y46_05010 [bacterium]|nr:hypothetical protein [bacterium]MCI0680369.1 hypothetical protein [bacterium]